MSYYRECPYCHGSLDPGEKCTCWEELERLTEKYEELTAVGDGGQLEFGGVDVYTG